MAFERAFWASPEKAALSFGQMNRSDLVQLLSDRFSQLTQGDAETAVSTILEAMCDRSCQIDLMAQGHFQTRDFGIDLFKHPSNSWQSGLPRCRSRPGCGGCKLLS